MDMKFLKKLDKRDLASLEIAKDLHECLWKDMAEKYRFDKSLSPIIQELPFKMENNCSWCEYSNTKLNGTCTDCPCLLTCKKLYSAWANLASFIEIYGNRLSKESKERDLERMKELALKIMRMEQ